MSGETAVYTAGMNPKLGQTLCELILGQSTAALGTLHDGGPYVSMVPYAMVPGNTGFVIHVSRLSSHTKDMLASPGVSVLVVARGSEGVPPQALPRVTIQGRAEPLASSTAGYSAARGAYVSRFPEAADIFELADFSLFQIRPLSVRLVAGFAQAVTLSPESFQAALNEGGQAK
jgi:heme iron utilization protein